VKSTSQRLKKALNNGGMEHKKNTGSQKGCGIWRTGIIERFMLPPWWK